ncbi:MAG: hypothetical protein M1608_18010, partial [Candidatus Omnitrophica bacterium]|nr:hypothetical protein [Candidatus Omnitrophota bacterium]
RWWGGGVPERPSFYELCDELGLLIYQDFPLANDNFDNEPMLGLLRKEGADFFRRWRNHPCILAWNGGNEWFTPKANAIIEGIAKEEDPTRAYFHPCGTQPGETHGPYNYVAENHYRRMNAFTFQAYTEFGCAAMANLATLRGIIPAADLGLFDAAVLGQTHPATDVPGRKAVYDCEGASWRFHNRWWMLPSAGSNSYHGFSTPPSSSLFGKIEHLDQYVAASQFLSGEGLRYSIEELRRRMFHSSATFVWQFNETWPNAAGNATVDWFGRPRITHFFVTRAYEPVHASLRYDRIHWRPGDTLRAELWATSDLEEELPGMEIRWEIFDGSGKRVAQGGQRQSLAAEASARIQNIEYPIPSDGDSFLLVLCSIRDPVSGKLWSQNDYLFGAHASTPHYFSPLLKASRTSLEVSVLHAAENSAVVRVRNNGPGPALFCRLDLYSPGDVAVTYSDNAFCLPPLGQRTVRITTHSLGKRRWKPDFTRIIASAWNSPSSSAK